MMVRPGLLISFALLAVGASAQGRGPGGGGPGGGGPGGGGRGGPFGMAPGGSRSAGAASQAPRTASHGSATGRWWDDSRAARSVGIDGRQQRHLDEIFETSKPGLVQLYTNLQMQQTQLETLRAHNADESQMFQQIDRVTQARGDLQKAYAHLQMQIRKELTAEQAAKLEQYHPS